MPPDRTSGLSTAAQRKRCEALGRARAAVGEFARHGWPVTFQAVARHAGVARQWLYQQPDLRAEIERLRGLHLQQRGEVPVREQATENSLRSRIKTLLDENLRLREEVAGLKQEIAAAYGAERAAATAAGDCAPAATISPANGSGR